MAKNKTELVSISGNRPYEFSINGPLFRDQRLLVSALHDTLPEPSQRLMDGLMNLLDSIADQAHDKYHIDCLITGDDSVTTSKNDDETKEDSQEHWWVCASCGAWENVSYDALAAAGNPYCSECDQEGIYIGSAENRVIYQASTSQAESKTGDPSGITTNGDG